jgi:hypothetical protein
MLPVSRQVPDLESYNSALESSVHTPQPPVIPPAARTSPFPSDVIVWSKRLVDMLAVGVQVLEVASNNSASATQTADHWVPLPPPATSTWPFGSRTAPKLAGVLLLPVGVQVSELLTRCGGLEGMWKKDESELVKQSTRSRVDLRR